MLVRKNKVSFFLVALVFMVSCNNENTVEPEVLSKAYVDILVVQELYRDNDSLQLKRNEVFQKYNISKENYDKSFKNINHNLEDWDIFFELANTYLDTLKSKEKKAAPRK